MPWIYNNGNPTLVSDRVARQRGGLIADRPSEDHVYNPGTHEVIYPIDAVVDPETQEVLEPATEKVVTEVIGWELPSDILINNLKEQINNQRDIQYMTGIIFDSHRFTYEDSIGLLTMVMKINDGQVNPHGGYWRDADNVDYVCDDVTLKLISDVLGDFLSSVSRESHTLKDSLNTLAYAYLLDFDAEGIDWGSNIFDSNGVEI